MRIGLFSDTYLPHANGVAICVENLRLGLEKAGHEVYVITCNDSLKIESDKNIIKLPSIILKNLYGYSATSPLHFNAYRKIKKLNLDIVHVHTEYGVGLFGRFIARYLRLPLIYTYHTMYEDYTHYLNFLDLRILDKPSLKFVEYVTKKYCDPSNVVIVPSKKTFNTLSKYNVNSEVVVLPSGIDLDKFKNVDKVKVEELRKELNLENKKVMIYLGRVAKEKNIEIVLDTFMEKKDSILLVVGLGPELEEFKEKYVSDNILFLGKKEYSDVPLYYSLADGFISASLSETQGLTFIEAMSCGNVLFCSDRVVLDELLIEGENGYFFDTKEELSEKIDKYYSNTEEKKKKMKELSYSLAMKYDLDLFIQKIEKIYEDNLEKVYKVKEIKYLENGMASVKINANTYFFEGYIIKSLGIEPNTKIDKTTLEYLFIMKGEK